MRRLGSELLLHIGLGVSRQPGPQSRVAQEMGQAGPQCLRIRRDEVGHAVVKHLRMGPESGGQDRGTRIEIRVDLHRRIEALETRRYQHIGPLQERIERRDRARAQEVHLSADVELLGSLAVALYILTT